MDIRIYGTPIYAAKRFLCRQSALVHSDRVFFNVNYVSFYWIYVIIRIFKAVMDWLCLFPLLIYILGNKLKQIE